MISVILDQFQILIILILLGIPIASFLIPHSKYNTLLTFLIAPFFGISLVILITTIVLGFGGKLSISISITLILWSIFISLQYKSLKKIFFNVDIYQYQTKILVGILGIIFILLLPNLYLQDGEIIKLRLGIDAALYIDAAQQLLDKGAITDLNTPLANAGFNVHFRWGVPILLVVFSKILHLKNIFQVLPIFLSICLLLNAFTIFILLNVFNNIKYFTSILISAAFILNVNLLNTLMEAQWAHTLSIAFLPLITYFLIEIRKLSDFNSKIKYYLIAAFIFIPLVVIYSEIIPVFILIIIFTSIFDYFYSKDKIFINFKLIIYLIFSIALIYPYSKLVIPHLLSLNIKAAGYGLPLWLFPNELFGLGDIYHRYSEWMIPEASMMSLARRDWIFSVLISFAIIYCIFRAITNLNTHYKSIYLSIIIIFLIGLIKFGLIDKSNYSYTKLSLTLMPFLLVLIMIWLSKDLKRNVYIYIYCGIVSLYGFQYLSDFSQSSYAITKNTIKMAEFITRGGDRCSILFRSIGMNEGSQRWVDRTLDFAMVPLFKRNYIVDQNSNVPYGYGTQPNDYEANRICIAVDKKQFYSWPKLVSFDGAFYSNSQWLIIKTDVTVHEFLSNPTNFYSKHMLIANK